MDFIPPQRRSRRILRATDLHLGEGTTMSRDRSRNIPHRKRRRPIERVVLAEGLEERAVIGSALIALPELAATFPFDQALPCSGWRGPSGLRDTGSLTEPVPRRGPGSR